MWEWLKTDLVFSFFDGSRKEKMIKYRRKVQFYSREEKKLWEDFRHGLFFGTLDFVNQMKSAYLQDMPHKEHPQQRDVLRSADPRAILEEAAAVLDCDLRDFTGAGRMYGADKTIRDLLSLN